MFLSQLLEGIRVTKLFSMVYGKTLVMQDLQVTGVQYDSRKVRPGNIFVAIPGTAADGHTFIDNAVQNGAMGVVVQDDMARPDSYFLHAGVIKIVVSDSRYALGVLAANYHGHPSRRLQLVGVTGTNGKTTTTHLIKSVLEAAGLKVGLIGTIEYVIGSERLPATHTTPESLELNELLRRMADAGCGAAVMEVSSHALVQRRVDGLAFSAGVFTNLTQDHLDYHGSMEAYFRAKKLLLDGLAGTSHAIINHDDPYGDRIAADTVAPVLSYAVSADADVLARDVKVSIDGTQFRVEYAGTSVPVRSMLTGRFNVANILAAYATGLAMGVPPEQIVRGVESVGAVRGRFEQISSPAGWTAVIDYAHTPDALENCLRAIHDILDARQRGRIITVFGCGGNRDAGKRPLMGRIASSMSDVVVVTSDNPRNENPGAIIEQILAGVVPGAEVIAEADRRTAIRRGLSLARAGDVVLIAGKGHETSQVVGSTKVHFDDREEVGDFMGALA
jgi:UDP-N-acetylmuramoyl-L-alanyl-D-glutamate--2,6-diaminopimelate ligase